MFLALTCGSNHSVKMLHEGTSLSLGLDNTIEEALEEELWVSYIALVALDLNHEGERRF